MDMPLPVSPTSTTSNTSTWGGRPVQNVDVPDESLRVGENRTKPDHHDIANRLFFFPFSNETRDQSLAITAAGQLKCVSPVGLLTRVPALQNLVSLYDSLSFDAITFTCSLSAPKGACGSVFVGYYPFSPWFQTGDLVVEAQRHAAGLPNITRLLLSPESHLMSISDSQDIKFTIPWSYATSMIKMQDLPDLYDTGPYGNPVVYIYAHQLQYLSSITLPPLFKMTMQFHNLRFYGPSFDEVELQSGMEMAAGVAAATLAEQLIASTLDATFDSATEYLDFDPEPDEGYTRPTVVQPAFAGDTTSIGPPHETPVFAPRPFSQPSSHKVLEYLKRPQLIHSGTITTNMQDIALAACPTDPNYTTFPNGTSTYSTYFRWFSQVAQYWRGTISFYVVIFGHPMAEVQHNIVIDYPGGNSGITTADPGNWVVLRGISSGTHCIKIPMPYLNYSDVIPIFDSLTTTNSATLLKQGSSSFLYMTLGVISTMLDVSPNIPYAVFMAAEDDFVFYQPYAPGLNYVENVAESFEKVELQVGIPEPSETFETRAIPCAPLQYMLPLVHLEDFMQAWCRVLPFGSYDTNDEPIPDATMAAQPCFWPSAGGSAAWTPDVNNSWYVCNDYISLLSSQFLYYTGSIAAKAICVKSTTAPEYKYISLLPTNLVGRQPANNPFTGNNPLPYTSNLGNGTTITPLSDQPVLECVLPYRSVIPWNAVVPYDVPLTGYAGQITYPLVANLIATNLNLQIPQGDLQDALFRKKGRDYFLGVEGLLPPGMLWIAKGWDWSA